MNLTDTPKVKSHHRGIDSARFSDVLALASTILAVSLGIFFVHGGVKLLADYPYGTLRALAQVTGILTTLVALYGIVLSARPRYIEHAVGLDVMLVWHRVLGEGCAILLSLHIFLELYTRQRLTGWWEAIKAYTGGENYMALAAVGAFGFFIVSLTSLKAVRRKISYESWYFIHLLVYGATLMGFWHQIYMGSDFSRDKVAQYFWIFLHIFVLAIVVKSRLYSVILAWLSPLRVKNIEQSAHDTLVVTLAGKSLSRIKAESGQFAMLRFLTRDLWFESHPFSLSAAPKVDGIRFTIKLKGDGTRMLHNLKIGHKVILEGPYGAIVKSQIKKERALLIAGGVGIAPIRALMEDFTPENEPYLIFRVKSKEDVVHLDELEKLCLKNNGKIFLITGSTNSLASSPFLPENLERNVPDLRDRQAVLCGPESMILSGVKGLLKAGVPYESIHYERSWW